jgi:hypothetical protein
MGVIVSAHIFERRLFDVSLTCLAQIALYITACLLIHITIWQLDPDLTAGAEIHACGHMQDAIKSGHVGSMWMNNTL